MRHEFREIVRLVKISPVPAFNEMVNNNKAVSANRFFHFIGFGLVKGEFLGKTHYGYFIFFCHFAEYGEDVVMKVSVVMAVYMVSGQAEGKIFIHLAPNFTFYFFKIGLLSGPAYYCSDVVVNLKKLVQIYVRAKAESRVFFREAHSLLAPLSFHKQRGARDNAVLMGVNYCLIDPFAIAEIVGVDNKLFHLLDYLPLNKSLGYLNCVKRRSLQQVVRDNPEREAIVG